MTPEVGVKVFVSAAAGPERARHAITQVIVPIILIIAPSL
jgi:hypothetical protein